MKKLIFLCAIISVTSCAKSQVGPAANSTYTVGTFVGGSFDVKVYQDLDKNGLTDRPMGDSHAMPYKSMVLCQFLTPDGVVDALVYGTQEKFLEVKYSNGRQYYLEKRPMHLPAGASNYDPAGRLTGALYYYILM